MQLRQHIISGVKYSLFSTIITAGAQLLRIIILTRFLKPSDFGLVAIVTLIIGFTNLFSDLGFSVALMHKQHVTEKEFSSIYWFNWGVNIILFLILCILTPLLAKFYSENILNKLIPLLGCQFIFFSIGKLYAVQMQKELHFRFISIRDIIGAVISLIVAIVAAYYGFGVYSIIISILVNVLIVNVLFFVGCYKFFPITFHFSLSETKSFLKIGLFQTGAQIFDYFANNIDIILIGKFFGTENLGIYNLAKELIIKPISIINSIINKVAMPLFSRLQTDATLLKNIYCNVIKNLTNVTFPILSLFFICSVQFITLFYGIKFIEVTPLFEILLLSGLISAIGNPSGSLAIAKGRTDLSFYWTLIRFALGPIIIVICSLYSIKAVAIGQNLLSIFFYYLFYKFIISKLVSISFKEYVSLIIPPLLICIFVIILCKTLMIFISFKSPIIGLIVFCSIFSTFYLTLSWLFNIEFHRSIKTIKQYVYHDKQL